MEWFIVISLLLMGLFLIVLEIIFIPGTTLFGIGGALLSIWGVYLGYSYFGTTAGHIILVGAVVLNGVVTVFSLRSNAWKRFALKGEMDWKVTSSSGPALEIGDIGKTNSVLKPIGKAEFKDIEYEVSTLGSYVEANEQVEVIKINGTKIIVEPINK